MSLASLLAQHGYWIVFVGALAEGESVLILGGFAAHRGLLRLPELMFVAFVAGTLGDQLGFHLGRHLGPRLFTRFPSVARQAQRVQPLLDRHPNVSVLAVRFIYGLRTAGPMAMGALGVPRIRFTLLNMTGAAVWAAFFVMLGYQFGNVMQWWLEDLRRADESLLAAMIIAALAWALWRRRRR
jgi:membrane protein DedA with SNARE-associated domain